METNILILLYGTFISYSALGFACADQFLIGKSSEACEITNMTMTCANIPRSVPDYIRTVIVTNHVGTFQSAFLGSGWGNVEVLFISGYDDSTSEIASGQLKGLSNVRELSLTLTYLFHIAADAFADTPRVEKISFLKSNKLEMDSAFAAMARPGVLMNLTEIVFDPNIYENPPQVYLSNVLMNRLLQKPLNKVQITHVVIMGEMEAYVKLMLKGLDSLNISGSRISWLDGNYSFLEFDYESSLPKVVDISDTVGPYEGYTKGPYGHLQQYATIIQISWTKIVLHVERLYMNNVAQTDQNMTFPSYTWHTKSVLKVLFARQNCIRQINGTLIPTTNNSLETLDLSNNKIGFLPPASLSPLIHLETLNLSNNRLFEMQSMLEFSRLFSSQRNLSALYLAGNDISFIPSDIFRKNMRIEVLDLARNKLTNVAFDLSNLNALKMFDLTRNQIHFIEGNFMVKLASFVQARRKHGELEIQMQNNPLECSCKSVDFIQWLYTGGGSGKDMPYRCTYEGSSIIVDETAINKCKFLCKRTVILIIITTLFTVFVTLMGALIYALRRTRNYRIMKNREHNFKQALINGLLPEDYICFISSAGKDDEIVYRSFTRPLKAVLKERLNTNRKVIVTGYNFKPGFSIYEEAFRFITKSRVFLAVVSDAFCESEYCKGEIREAYTLKKSIVVLLLGTVAEDKMSPYLLEVFRRNARAKIAEREDGDHELIPDIETLADSILELAICGNKA